MWSRCCNTVDGWRDDIPSSRLLGLHLALIVAFDCKDYRRRQFHDDGGGGGDGCLAGRYQKDIPWRHMGHLP